MAELDKKHKAALAKTSDSTEIKEENYVHKNRISNEKLELEKEYQTIKDKKHEAYSYKYHLIDMLRLSKFTFMEKRAQKWENYKYTFNRRNFLLQNGLYIAIILIFIALCVITPIKKGTPLLTYNNILNILQQASPRMFLALGVAGLILLTGTDLSVGRMVGMGMTTATIIMHNRVSIQVLYSVMYLTLQEYQQVQELLSHYLHVSCFVHSSQVLQDFLQRSLRCIRLFQPWPTCLLSSVS